MLSQVASSLAMTASWISSFFFLILLYYSITAQPYDHPVSANLYHSTTPRHYDYSSTANLSTTWINKQNGGSLHRVILVRETDGTRFLCGFFCNQNCTSYIFAIMIVPIWRSLEIPSDVLWSANRDYPVKDGAILNLTAAGELVLQDIDGRKVWTTNTTGKTVVSMNLTSTGNLVLSDVHNSMVWQSFDHPTDCLLLGQKLFQGQKLISSISSSEWTKGQYSLQVTNEGLFAYIESNPPQVYASIRVQGTNTNKGRSYVRFLNGSLSLFIFSVEPSDPDLKKVVPLASSVQYMKLMPDGHLNVFEWKEEWVVMSNNLLTGASGDCGYPLACGRNAICSYDQQCSCPVSTSPWKEYYRLANNRQPKFGCLEITPLSCNSTQDQALIPLGKVESSTFTANVMTKNIEACKQACIKNCSCKAALFKYRNYTSEDGYCYLPNELFTITDTGIINDLAVSAFLKVQNIRSPPSSTPQTPGSSPKKKNRVATVLGSTIGGIVLLFGMVTCFIIFIVHKRKKNAEMEEEYLNQVPGMPTRFSYEELNIATKCFSKKLGEGGFGSVFEGTLEDGSNIAVKCLKGPTHVKKSFLAEIESVGSIHHVNLVTLKGFCALKSQPLLVYEFMSNGSLDRWIYNGYREHVLEWECRKKIVLDIAKGLAYLHEDCRQKIIHLDIKPQNILLDYDFNAKIADFGLSKLVDRNQTQVRTNMRGTPGYLAPEWLSSVITEKVDVYSFGIVLLEILCGRKNFDRSQPEESRHLLAVFQECWEQGKLLDIVDRCSEDMQANGTKAVEMMKVASWCLQTDFTRRPSMSLVIKVLEGVMQVESNLDYNFTNLRLENTKVRHEIVLTQMMPSFLSGPR